MNRAIRLTAGALLLAWSAATVAAIPPSSLPVRFDYRPIFAEYGIYDEGLAIEMSGADIDTSPDRTLASHLDTGATGDVSAWIELAVRYESGRGVAADPVRAFAYYQAAALRGDGFAQEQVARAYESGRGVGRDAAQAVRWYRLAADQGLPAAQVALVRLFTAGGDVSPDPAQAYRWVLAILNNPDIPQETRRQIQAGQQALEAQLAPEQLDAARRWVREWKTAGHNR